MKEQPEPGKTMGAFQFRSPHPKSLSQSYPLRKERQKAGRD